MDMTCGVVNGQLVLRRVTYPPVLFTALSFHYKVSYHVLCTSELVLIWFPQDHCHFRHCLSAMSTAKTANNWQACSLPINLILTSCSLYLWHFFVSVLSLFLILRVTYQSSHLCFCRTPVTRRYYRWLAQARSRPLRFRFTPLHTAIAPLRTAFVFTFRLSSYSFLLITYCSHWPLCWKLYYKCFVCFIYVLTNPWQTRGFTYLHPSRVGYGSALRYPQVYLCHTLIACDILIVHIGVTIISRTLDHTTYIFSIVYLFSPCFTGGSLYLLKEPTCRQ
jgi:hypothetical protein